MTPTIRPAVPDDAAYVASTWLNSQKETGWWARVPAPIYREYHRNSIIRLLSRPECRVLIACDPEDDTLILGWVVFEPNSMTSQGILHYVFTRRSERKRGVARALMAATELQSAFESTAWSHEGSLLLAALKLPLRFNPYKGC